MTKSPQLIEQRSFGLLEKYQTSKTLVECYGSVTCAAILKHSSIPRTKNTSSTTFYLNQLYPAISQLVKKHPLLSMIVNDYKEPTAHFSQLPSFSLAKIIDIQEQQEITAMSLEEPIQLACDEELLNDSAILDVPLWRLKIIIDPTVLDQCAIILIVHHVIMDGKSLTIFWKDLLQFLNKTDATMMNNNNKDDDDDQWMIQTNPLSPMTLPSPFELRELIPKPSIKDYSTLFYKLLSKSLLPTYLQRQLGIVKDVWQGDHPTYRGQRHDTLIKIRQLVGNDWKNIVHLAKKQYHISVHAVVYAAFLLSWAELYPEMNTVMTTPINYRQLINANGELGNFVGAYDHVWYSKVIQDPSLPPETSTSVKSDSPLIWRVAAHYHHHLQMKKERSCIGGQFLGLLKYPKEYCNYWYDFFKDNELGRSGGLEHSDLGRFDINNYDDGLWEVQSLYFAQSAQVYSTALGLNTITVKDGLYATLTLQNKSVDETKALKIMDRFIDILKNIH